MRFLDSFAMQRTEKEVLTEPSWQYTVDHFILVYVKLEEPIGHLGDHMQKEAGDTQQGKVKINGYKETRGLALCVCYGGKGIIISLGYSTSSNGEESQQYQLDEETVHFPRSSLPSVLFCCQLSLWIPCTHLLFQILLFLCIPHYIPWQGPTFLLQKDPMFLMSWNYFLQQIERGALHIKDALKWHLLFWSFRILFTERMGRGSHMWTCQRALSLRVVLFFEGFLYNNNGSHSWTLPLMTADQLVSDEHSCWKHI